MSQAPVFPSSLGVGGTCIYHGNHGAIERGRQNPCVETEDDHLIPRGGGISLIIVPSKPL